jgi:hypothetical protein
MRLAVVARRVDKRLRHRRLQYIRHGGLERDRVGKERGS